MEWQGYVPDSSGCLERRRRSYSKQELTLLNAEYDLCPYPSQPQRQRIAEYLNIPERSVLWWFQNKRRYVRMNRGRGSKAGHVLHSCPPRPSPYQPQVHRHHQNEQHEHEFQQNGFQPQMLNLKEMCNLSDLLSVPADFFSGIMDTPTSTQNHTTVPQTQVSTYPEQQVFHQQYEHHLPSHHHEPSAQLPFDWYPSLTPESPGYATGYHHQNCVSPAPAVVPSFNQLPFQWNPYWDHHNQSLSFPSVPANHYQNCWYNSTDLCQNFQ